MDAVGHVRVVEDDDVRVGELGDGLGLPLEPADGVGLVVVGLHLEAQVRLTGPPPVRTVLAFNCSASPSCAIPSAVCVPLHPYE